MENLQQIFESYRRASGRTLSWFFVILITSFIAFTMFWNSRVINWNIENIRYLNIVERYQQNPGSLTSKQKEVLQRAIDKFGEEFILQYEVKEVMERLNNQTSPFAYVEFPIVGIKFHINDMAIITGWAFVLVMFGSFFASRNLLANTEILKEASGSNNNLQKIASIYHVLPKTQNKLIIILSRLPYFMPLSLMILILINDYKGKELGMMISPVNMTILFISSSICILLIAWLTFAQLSYLRKSHSLINS